MAEVSDWVTARMLVIIIICPLATSEAVMVTQQLNQTAIKDRQQLLRLMLFWRWKAKKYRL